MEDLKKITDYLTALEQQKVKIDQEIVNWNKIKVQKIKDVYPKVWRGDIYSTLKRWETNQEYAGTMQGCYSSRDKLEVSFRKFYNPTTYKLSPHLVEIKTLTDLQLLGMDPVSDSNQERFANWAS